MTLEGPATRLTVMVGESDQAHHHPVYTEIVHRAHKAGLAGASVFRGIEGYGKSNHIHTTRLLSRAPFRERRETHTSPTGAAPQSSREGIMTPVIRRECSAPGSRAAISPAPCAERRCIQPACS